VIIDVLRLALHEIRDVKHKTDSDCNVAESSFIEGIQSQILLDQSKTDEKGDITLEGGRSCICVLGVTILYLSTILFWNCSDGMVFFYFHLKKKLDSSFYIQFLPKINNISCNASRRTSIITRR
jgi:hypothetical protein